MPDVNRWSMERVIEEIRDWHRCGLPLTTVWRRNPKLYDAAKRYAGNWHNALVAAGLAVRRVVKLTRQEVIEAIQSGQRQGLPITNARQVDKELRQAAKEHFMSWNKALIAAGLKPKLMRKWSRQIVVSEIKERHRRGLPTRNISKHDDALRAAACVYFGSWNNALVASGLEPRGQKWNRQRVIDEIITWSKKDSPKPGVWRSCRGLSCAAYKYLGGRHNAMVAAGIESKPQEKWSNERIIDELRAFRRQGLHGNALREKYPNLIAAATRHFGGMKNALSAAGLKPLYRGKWTRTYVIKQIQNRYIRGLSLYGVRVQTSSLAHAARRHFATWSDALVAAGILHEDEKPKPKVKWSKQRVIERAKARYEQGLPMVNIAKYDVALALAASKHFGGWRNAVAAAGLGSQVKFSTRWSEERVIREIQQRVRKGLSLSSALPANNLLHAAALRYFRRWHKALAAAGITPEAAKRTFQKKPKKE